MPHAIGKTESIWTNKVTCHGSCLCHLFSAITMYRNTATLPYLHIVSIDHCCTTLQIWLLSFICRRQSKYPQREGNVGCLAESLNPEVVWKGAAVYPGVEISLCLLFAPFLWWKKFGGSIGNVSAVHPSFWNGSLLKLKGERRLFPASCFQRSLSISLPSECKGTSAPHQSSFHISLPSVASCLQYIPLTCLNFLSLFLILGRLSGHWKIHHCMSYQNKDE